MHVTRGIGEPIGHQGRPTRYDEQPLFGILEDLLERDARVAEIGPARMPAPHIRRAAEQEVVYPPHHPSRPTRSSAQHQLPIVLVGSTSDLTVMGCHCSAPIGMTAMRHRFALQQIPYPRD